MNTLIVDIARHPVFMSGLIFLLTVVLIFMLVRFAQHYASTAIENKDIRFKARKLIAISGYGLGVVLAIAIFSDQFANLAVIIGALSVGIGFALRELIQNLIGWVSITLGSLYKTGDRIQLGSTYGDVMDIGPLVTTVMECGQWVQSDLYNGRVTHIPNNIVLREPVINFTSDFPFLWDEIVIPIKLGSDHKMARSLIESVGRSVQSRNIKAAQEAWNNFVRHNRTEEAGLEPVVTMSFDANWIEFTLRYMTDYRSRRSTKDRLYKGILEGIEHTGGKVEVACPPIHIRNLVPS